MEDFGYQKDEAQSKFSDLAKRAFLVGATLFSLACFVYVTISAYYFVYQEKDGDIELIKAEEGPIKVLEEGKSSEDSAANSMQIDRSIYEDIFGNKGERKEVVNTKIDKIPQPALPPKPNELDRRLIKEALPQNGANSQIKEATLLNSKKSLGEQQHSKTRLEQNETRLKADANFNKNRNAAEQKIVVFSDTQKKESPSQDLLTKTSGEKTVAPIPANTKSQKRAVRVQVAALTSEASAKEAWNKLNQLHPSLFSGLKSFTEAVNLGKRGIFYRLQIGNFYNQIEAEEFCNRYVAKTQKSRADCIVVE
jgi:hypothetical protein